LILRSRGHEYYEEGKRLEREGKLDEAVKKYKLAEKAGHDLQDDYDGKGHHPTNDQLESEHEDTPYLTKADESMLEKHQHAMDYKLSEEEKVYCHQYVSCAR
jgi:hypothetical protein